MTNLTIDDAIKHIQKENPEVWKAVYTKHIDAPGNYFGFKAVAVGLASSILEGIGVGQPPGGTPLVNVAAAAAQMEKYNYPVYYVSQTLLTAMLHTSPKDLTWSDVFFPFEGLVFMLPKNALHEEPSGSEIIGIGVSKVPDYQIKIPGTNKGVAKPVSKEPMVSVFWILGPSCLEVQCCTFTASQKLQPSPDWIDQKTEDYSQLTRYQNDDWPSGKFSSFMAGVAANLLLVMQIRKEVVEKGSHTGRKLGNGTPIHTPTFVGRKYEIIKKKRLTKTTSAHFTELGWRAGCIRKQHYGPSNTLTKLIIIDPYIAFIRGLVQPIATQSSSQASQLQ